MAFGDYYRRGNTSIKDPTESVSRQIDTYERQIRATGKEVPKVDKGPLLTILDWIDRPLTGLNTMFREFTNPEAGLTPNTFDPLKAFSRGFTRQENNIGKDVMKDLGVSDKPWFTLNIGNTKIQPNAAGLAGFAMDMFNPLDPINWVGGAIVKGATKGTKGTAALAKAFGDDAAQALTKALGKGADDLMAKSVGALSGQVKNKLLKAASEGAIDPGDIQKYMDLATEGMTKLGNKATTKIPYSLQGQLGLEVSNPITRKSYGTMPIPGTKTVASGMRNSWDWFVNTKFGDDTMKALKYGYKSKNVPDSVIMKELRQAAKERDPEVMSAMGKQLNDLISQRDDILKGNPTGAVGDLNKEIKRITEIIDADKVPSRAIEYSMTDGPVAFSELFRQLNDMQLAIEEGTKRALSDVQQLFKGVPEDVRKLITRRAAGESIDLPTGYEGAYDSFLKWREGILKTYNELGIEIPALEKYVPFIPERGLKRSEKEFLRSKYGRAPSAKDVDETTDLFGFLASNADKSLQQRSVNALNPHDINEQLSKEWLSEDAAVLMAVRGVRAVKGQETLRLMQEVVDKFGLNVEDIAELTRRGLIDPQLSGYKYFVREAGVNGKAIFKEISQASTKAGTDVVALPEEFVKTFNDYVEVLYAPGSGNTFKKVFDTATRWFKKAAYLYNPGHIPRDFYSNIYQGWMMGIRPSQMGVYKDAADILSELVSSDKARKAFIASGGNAADYVAKGGKKLKYGKWEGTADELMAEMRKRGALDVGMLKQDNIQTLVDKIDSAIGKKGPANIAKRYEDVMANGTYISDLYTRTAGFIHQLKQGKSLDEAAVQVKKFYFNYFELTPIERKYLKPFIPFYTWMRNNIPLQVEQLITSPRLAARTDRAMRYMEGDDRSTAEEEPDYLRGMMSVRLPGEEGKRKYWTPNLPIQDLANIPITGQGLRNLASAVNPLLRVPAELAGNSQWFSEAPIEKFTGEKQAVPLSSGLTALINGATGQDLNAPKILPRRGIGYILDQIPMLRNLDIMTNPEHPRQGARASSTLLGLPSWIPEETAATGAMYERRDQLDDIIQLLRSLGIEVPKASELTDNQPKKGFGSYNRALQRR